MKIQIARLDESIFTIKDYSDIKDSGEVAHIICELESIKADLLEIWEDLNEVAETHDN